MTEIKNYVRYWLVDSITIEDEVSVLYYSYDSDDETPRVTNGFLSQLKWNNAEKDDFEASDTTEIRTFTPDELVENATAESIGYYYSYYTEEQEKEDIVQGFCKDCVHCFEADKDHHPFKIISDFILRDMRLVCDKHTVTDYVTGNKKYKYCFEYNLTGGCRLYEKRPEENSEDSNTDGPSDDTGDNDDGVGSSDIHDSDVTEGE